MVAGIFIQSQNKFDSFVESIAQDEWIGLDTEFLRERTYTPLLCLIQISCQKQTACIDPLSIEDLSSLFELFSNTETVKIIHSCRQDLEALATRSQSWTNRIYDTQLAAAFCGFGDQLSYASLVAKICQQQLDKSHTRTDWSKRPLHAAQLQYAIEDVYYLYDLYRYLQTEVDRLKRGAWLDEEINNISNPRTILPPLEDSWRRLKGLRRLSASAQEIAKKLAIWREKKARQLNRPREWILASHILLDISRLKPEKIVHLKKVDGLNASLIRHSGKEILSIINQAKPELNEIEFEQNGRQYDLTKAEKSTVKFLMERLTEIARDERISQSLIANRQSIVRLVKGDRNLSLLQGWRYQLAGKFLLSCY